MNKDTNVIQKSDSLNQKRIALCVTGGIAACETVKLSRELRRYGARVTAYMTEEAQKFMTPLSLAWATDENVVTEFSKNAEHIDAFDLVLVAPMTHNTLNQFSHGTSSTVVTALLASAMGEKKPIVCVPTMHESMAKNPIYLESFHKLNAYDNITFIEALKEEEKEKFPDIQTLVLECAHLVNRSSKLAGKHVLLTGGPTKAPIDAVRYISNFSTGELSVQLANEIYAQGANVTLVYGPGRVIPPLKNYRVVDVETPQDMLDQVLSEVQYQKVDAAIFSAAVLDHVPFNPVSQKLSSKNDLHVSFQKTPKIIREIDRVTRKSCESVTKNLFKIGFKLEVGKTKEALIQIGKDSLENMNAQVMVLNNLNEISNEKHKAYILNRSLEIQEVQTKKEMIHALLNILQHVL